MAPAHPTRDPVYSFCLSVAQDVFIVYTGLLQIVFVIPVAFRMVNPQDSGRGELAP